MAADCLELASEATQGTAIIHEHDRCIVVRPGATLDAAGGDIRLEAPAVTVGAGARLQSRGATQDGTIELKAKDIAKVANISIWNQLQTILRAGGQAVKVDIGEGAVLDAGAIEIETQAGDELAPGLNDYNKTAYGQLYDITTTIVNNLTSLPLTGIVRSPSSTITVGPKAQLKSSGTVSISSSVALNQYGQAVWSTLADRITRSAIPGGISAGLMLTDVEATATLAADAVIDAADRVSVTTSASNVSIMFSNASGNTNADNASSKSTALAVSINQVKSISRIATAVNSQVNAGESVTLNASGTNVNMGFSTAAAYEDGMAGAAYSHVDGAGTVEVLVDGRINASKSTAPAKLAFSPALQLDFTERAIVFPDNVALKTGDQVLYSSGGGLVPGLASDRRYYAIVDPAAPRKLGLALTLDDAQANRRIDFGAGYPTVGSQKGKLPITSVDAAGRNALQFDVDTWPDGAPLFVDNEPVTYTPLAGHYLGRNDASGNLLGELPAGNYRVRVLDKVAGDAGLSVQLLDGQGRVVDLNDNPLFRTDDGRALQVFGFDSKSSAVRFDFPRQGAGEGELPFAMPRQVVNLVNGQPMTYVQAIGTRVPGLEDGRLYYAIVDPVEPGVVRLAESESQARAADPRVQDAKPSLQTQEANAANRRTLVIDHIEAGVGLGFAEDPKIADGTVVVFRQVAAKPVAGLEDGTRYFVFNEPNADPNPARPRFFLSLRTTPDRTAPAIGVGGSQQLRDATAGRHEITGVDPGARMLAVSLPRAAMILSADSQGLVAGRASFAKVNAGSLQMWTNATAGTFHLYVTQNGQRVASAPIAFDATAEQVRAAAASLPGVTLQRVTGRGRYAAPWTFQGTGLELLEVESEQLRSGEAAGAVWMEEAAASLQAVWTDATAGLFRLTLDAAGGARPTASIPVQATAEEVERIISEVSGLHAQVRGDGTTSSPWLVDARQQPFRSGDPVVFEDSWGTPATGLVHGDTYYGVVQPWAEQGKEGSVVLGLAATREDALNALPTLVPLADRVSFRAPEVVVMSGANHELKTGASGIDLSAMLISIDGATVQSSVGGEVGPFDSLAEKAYRKRPAAEGAASPEEVIRGSMLSVAGDRGSLSEWLDEEFGGLEGDVEQNEPVAGKHWVKATGAAARVVIKNTARVVVGETAKLMATGDISLTSAVVAMAQTAVDSGVTSATNGKVAAAVAVSYSRIENTSVAIVHANAMVLSGGAITIASVIDMPWAGRSKLLMANEPGESSVAEVLKRNWPTILLGLLSPNLGLNSYFVNHWVQANINQKAEASSPNQQSRSKVTVSGAVSWSEIENHSVARIEDGAQVNQFAGETIQGRPLVAGDNPVSLIAKADVGQVNFAGSIHFDLSLPTLFSTFAKFFRRDWKAASSLLKLSGGGKMLGGSGGYVRLANDTRAMLGGIEEPEKRRAKQPVKVAYGNGGLTVFSENAGFLLQMGQSGTAAQDFGLAGSASIVDASKQTAQAAILGAMDPAMQPVIRSHVGTSGDVLVSADDDSWLVPVAGAVLTSASKNVGVSVAIARMDRDVASWIGAKEPSDGPGGALDLATGGNLLLMASATGKVIPTSLAASVASGVKPKGVPQRVSGEQPAEAGQGGESFFGLAISGDYSEASLKDSVRAWIDGGDGRLQSAANPLGKLLLLSAKNTTLVQASAGAAAVERGEGTSAGLAGAASVVTYQSTVRTLLRRLAVDGFLVKMESDQTRPIGSLAASGKGARQGTQGTVTLQLAGSVTVVNLLTVTETLLDRVVGSSLLGMSLSATRSDKVWSGAGSFVLGFSLTGGTPGGSALGVGSSVAVHSEKTTTRTSIQNSQITFALGDLALAATEASRTIGVSAGIAVTGAGSTLSGMNTTVVLETTTAATIDGSTVELAGDGGVSVLATSALLLVSASGDLVLGRGDGSAFGVGAGVTVTNATVRNTARINGSTVRVKRGHVTVRARTRNPEKDAAIDKVLDSLYTPHRDTNAIWSFAAGVAGSNANVNLSFSVNVNTLTIDQQATVGKNSTIVIDDGSLAVEVLDEAGIYAGAGQIAAGVGEGKKSAAGAAVVRNQIDVTARALVDQSSVTVRAGNPTDGTIIVAATSAALIGAAVVGAEFAGKAGAGTSLVFNRVKQVVEAKVTADAPSQSVLDSAGAVSVKAIERSRIGSGAGQVAIATSGRAAGAAAAVNEVESRVAAVIERAKVDAARGTTIVHADARGEIYSYAVGVSGAWSSSPTSLNFAGVGSGTGNTLVRQIEASVRDSSRLTVDALSVLATDSAKIDTAAGTLGIQYSGKPGISAALGVSASTNTVGSFEPASAQWSFVRATIANSTVTVIGALKLSAVAALQVHAVTAAGAGEVSSGQGWGVGIAGAGSGSRNAIQVDVNSAILGSSITQQQSVNSTTLQAPLTVEARNTSAIEAIAGGVKVAGSGGNVKGINVTLGAAASVNEVRISTHALTDDARVDSRNVVQLQADGEARIRAISVGVAGSAQGGPGGFDISGVGSAAINTVHSDTLATVANGSRIGSEASKVAAISLTAVDRSSIVAGSGSVASLFAVGEGVGLGAAVGVAYSINEVTGAVKAAVDNSTIHASGDVSLEARYQKGQQDRNVFAVSVAGAAGIAAGSGGKLFPLAGAGNRNRIAMTVEAAVRNAAQVLTDAGLSLLARDESSIYSNAGGVGLGVSWGGGPSGGIAIGASYGKNEIDNRVRATLEQATLKARGGVTLVADGVSAIESIGFGVALDVNVADAAISGAGSGAGAYNHLTSRTEALILSSEVEAAALDVQAKDAPRIVASAGAGSLAVTVGNGGSLAAGAIVVENLLANHVLARIGRFDAASADPDVTLVGGLNLLAESRADVDALAVAVAASATFGEFGAALSGAGARSTAVATNLVLAEIEAGKVKAADVRLRAAGGDTVRRNEVGTGALAGAVVGGSIGVSLAENRLDNRIETRVGAALVEATGGDIQLLTRLGHQLAAEAVATSVAVALGGSGAGGHAFSEDRSQLLATVASNARLSAARGLEVSIDGEGADASRPEGLLKAYAHGGSLGLVSVGAVIAKATSAVERTATIEANVDLSKVRSLNLASMAWPNLSAWSVGADVGGVAVLVNQSTVSAAGSARATTGSGVTLPPEVQVMAFSGASLNVDQTGVNVGGIAAGATQSTAESLLVTEAVLGPDTRSPEGGLNLVRVSAISRDDLTRVKATAGTGGLFSGFGTTGDVLDSTRTSASLLGGTLAADTVDISALRFHGYDLDVNSVNVGLGAGVGATLARLKSTADVAVNVSDGTIIKARDTVTLRAQNTLQQVETGDTVDGGGGSLLTNGLAVSSSADVQTSSKINLGHRVTIESGVDPYDRRGGIYILPDVAVSTNDSVVVRNLGLLGSSSLTQSHLRANLSPQVLIGDQVMLASRGDLGIGTTSFVHSRQRTDGWGGGIIASGIATSASGDVDVDQKIRVGAGAVLSADGTLSVTAGDDPAGGSSSLLMMDTDAHAAVRSLVAVPAASATSRLTNRSSLEFGEGAKVSSGMSMYLAARANRPETKASGLAEGYQVGFIRTTSESSVNDPKTDSRMLLRGSFTAGRDNAVEILVPRNRPEAITATPATLGGQAVSWRIDPAFRPQEYAQQNFTPQVAHVLAQGLSQTPVQALTLGPLRVSGGSIDIAADTLESSDATIVARVGRIVVRNQSPAYLVTGPMSIANVEGGQVRVRRSNAVEDVAPPAGWRISHDDSVASISIEQTYDGAVGASSYGPAVLLDGTIQNLGGNVTITNTSGSFGQKDTIAARKIEMHIPNGVTVIDIPTKDWHLSTVPPVLAERSFPTLWPGGSLTSTLQNPNHAVMYAINAMSAFRKPAATTDSDGLLEDRVYGTISENRASYNFFGGSVPWSSNGRDSHDENARLSRDVRPDQTFKARRFGATDRSGSGWFPALQVLPTAVSTTRGTEQETASPSIFGDVVVINARTVNINGAIRAGRDTSGSDSVVLPASLESVLHDYLERFRQGVVTQAEYRIPADQLRRAAEQDRLIGATFDARSGQIRLDEAASTSGKLVAITGRIINTNASPLAGRIQLRGGTGDVTVRNETSWPLVTGNLYTGGKGHKSVISITDLLVEDAASRQTAYAYDGKDILVYRGPAGVDLTERAPIQRVLNQQATAYQPQADVRWQWKTEARLSRDVNFDLNRWTGIDYSGWRYNYPAGQPDSPWRFVDGDATAGTIVRLNTNETFRQEISATWDNEARLVQPYVSNPGPYYTGIVADREIRYPREVTLQVTSSLKAAYPIGVDFSGSSFGTVQVWSQGPLLLAGTIQSPTVKLESSGSIKVIEARGEVDAERLEVSSTGNVGTVEAPVSFQGDLLKAVSRSGSIHLRANARDRGRSILLESVSAANGSVWLESGGNLLGVTAVNAVHVAAREVRLEAWQGTVGTAGQPIVLEPSSEADKLSTRRIVVDVLAQGMVHLRQRVGDMLVGQVESLRGSVQMEVAGNVYDAATWNINEAEINERLAAMRRLGVTDPNAYLQDVAALEAAVTSRYQLYWALRKGGDLVRGRLRLRDDALSLWTIQASEKLQLPNPADAQVRTFAADLFAAQEGYFLDNVGPDWKVRTEFRSYDASFRYKASAAQVERFSKDRTLNEVELALRMGLRALQAADLDAPDPRLVNVRGQGIRIASQYGSVGKIESPVRVTTEQLASGTLTQEQRLQLGLAGLPGDAVRAEDGLVLSVRRPLHVQLTGGRLDVEAPRGVTVRQPEGDLRIGRIHALEGLVSVMAQGSVLRDENPEVHLWSNTVGFREPEKWSIVGDTGAFLGTEGDRTLRFRKQKETHSAAWYREPVSTGSFRASFVYWADSTDPPGDGLAFVLQTAGTEALGERGAGLGYVGIPGPKVAFQINLYEKFGEANRGTNFDTKGLAGPYEAMPFRLSISESLLMYVTLEYDAVLKTLTTTISNQPDPADGESRTRVYTDVDLRALLGAEAYLGFTAGTGARAAWQDVSGFQFESYTGRRIREESRIGFDVDKLSAAWAATATSDAARFQWTNGQLKFPETPFAASAMWYKERVPLRSFQVSFRYKHSSSRVRGDGFAFVLQNGEQGTQALGEVGGGLGYTGITGKKVGYLFEINDRGAAVQGSRYDVLGVTGNYRTVSNFPKDQWHLFTLTYDAEAQTLTERIDVAGVSPVEYVTEGVNLAEVLGSDTAYMGFTAASGAHVAEQTFADFSLVYPAEYEFPQGDQPADWYMNGNVQTLVGDELEVADTRWKASSTWYRQPVGIGAFHAEFTFKVWQNSQPADGFAFVLQNSADGVAALGRYGSALGYEGITGRKAALMINVFQSPGMRFDNGSETGIYEPLPAWVVGDPVAVTLDYDAFRERLEVTLRSVTTGEVVSRVLENLNLPALLGGTSAWMGITTGTGDSSTTMNFKGLRYREVQGIYASAPAGELTPEIYLRSSRGDIGRLGKEIDVFGITVADAPNGEVHTSPPVLPDVRLVDDSGHRNTDQITNDARLSISPVRLATLQFSVDGGTTWTSDFVPVEGLNRIHVVQTNARGQRSEPSYFEFVLDRQPPEKPQVTVATSTAGEISAEGEEPRQANIVRSSGELEIRRLEANALVEYSVNGADWRRDYQPVSGLNAVRVRQVDLAGNVSPVSDEVQFILEVVPPPVAHAWTNATNRLDVNGDGVISPLDALWVINHLNTRVHETGKLPAPTKEFGPRPIGTAGYLDVNGDAYASAIDVLLVLNHLNQQEPIFSEGEPRSNPGTAEVDGIFSIEAIPIGPDWSEVALAVIGNEPNRRVNR